MKSNSQIAQYQRMKLKKKLIKKKLELTKLTHQTHNPCHENETTQ